MKKQENAFGKFKIELDRSSSRVVVVPENITLWQVHDLIQMLFGWEDCHLWEFEDFEGRRFGPPPQSSSMFAFEKINPIFACLSDVLPRRGLKLKYTYDFGDCWQHVISRLADPKEGKIACLKSIGPDGVEDSRWMDPEEYTTVEPTAEEVSERLAFLDLTPLPAKTGLIENEERARKDMICSLNDEEWMALCHLGEEPDDPWHPIKATERMERIPDILPNLFCSVNTERVTCLCADLDFRRYWRKNKKTFLAWRDERVWKS